MCYSNGYLTHEQGRLTVSWMLKVTRGAGEDTSTRISGKSASTSPILELKPTLWESHFYLILFQNIWHLISQHLSKPGLLLVRFISSHCWASVDPSRVNIFLLWKVCELPEYQYYINPEIICIITINKMQWALPLHYILICESLCPSLSAR